MRQILAVLLLTTIPADAWWDEGHKVVARIAARHLTPAAQARVAQLLDVGNDPQIVAAAVAEASIWADEHKGETHTEAWHFLDLAWQDDRDHIAERCNGDECVTARIALFTDQLKAAEPDPNARFSDSDALRFLLHFVGDAHQPLHLSSNADRGGNCEAVEGATAEAGNIHALWDGPLVSRMGTDDATLAAELDAEVGEMSEGDRSALTAGEMEDWAWDSHRLAIQNVYKRLNIPKEDVDFPTNCGEAPQAIRDLRIEIDEQYLDDMRPFVRDQLKKAGLRLAKLLNGIFS